MKILHTVEFYSPSVGGMQEVVKHISERLAERGHDITVATSFDPKRKKGKINGVSIKEFKISGNDVRGIKGNQKEYIDFIKNGQFDIVTNFAAQQWASDLVLKNLKEIKSKKIFVPTGFSGLFNPQFSKYFDKIPKFLTYYDSIIYLSNDYRDISFSREFGINQGIVIPNGSSEIEFSSFKEDTEILKKYGINQSFIILNISTHTGAKGHFEAIQIFKELNLNDSAFVIIGNTLKEISHSCVNKCKELAKEVNAIFNSDNRNNKIYILDIDRHSTIKMLKNSDLFLFTSNIECSPLVLFEAMAAKLPFATVDVGNSKEIINWSKGGFLLPTVFDKLGNSFADIKGSAVIIKEFIKNRSSLKELGRNGRLNWEKKFTWAQITNQYENLYRNLLKNQKPIIFKTRSKRDFNYSIILSSSSKEELFKQLKNISEQSILPQNVIILNPFLIKLNPNDYKFDIKQILFNTKLTPKLLKKIILQLSSTWLTFLPSGCVWSKERLERIKNVINYSPLKDVGLVHSNFDNPFTLNSITQYDNFDTLIRGKCTNRLINNEQYPHYSHIFIKRELFNSLLHNFNLEGEYLFDFLVLLASMEVNFEYSYSKTVLHTTPITIGSIENKLRLINELIDRELVTFDRAEIWGSDLVNKVINNLPDTKTIKIFNEILSLKAKSMLFRQKGGSLEKFILARIFLNYKNTLSNFLSSSKSLLLNSIRLLAKR